MDTKRKIEVPTMLVTTKDGERYVIEPKKRPAPRSPFLYLAKMYRVRKTGR